MSDAAVRDDGAPDAGSNRDVEGVVDVLTGSVVAFADRHRVDVVLHGDRQSQRFVQLPGKLEARPTSKELGGVADPTVPSIDVSRRSNPGRCDLYTLGGSFALHLLRKLDGGT